MAKDGVWDPKVKVEANAYNWRDAPIARHDRASSVDSNPLVHLDLFSGCGGFSVGFEAAGFLSKVALDIHPPSLDTFAHNHPGATTLCGDIRQVTTGMISDALGKVRPTVITAGVPCQGFSRSNRKRHAEDERNFLFHEFIRVARDLRPEYVVLENVSGLVTTAGGEFKRAIGEAIEELGYTVHVRMLNAADYGVPQKRLRIFFVGVPKGMEWRWPEATHGGHRRPYENVRDAILDLPELKAGEVKTAYERDPFSPLQGLLRGTSAVLLNHEAPDHPAETIARIQATAPGQPMYPDFKQRIRLHPDRPSPTQICGGIRPQFQFGHPTQPRGLSIRERARIQSFPDRYEFIGGLVQGRVQTGNAVPPLLAQAVAAQLRRLNEGTALSGVADDDLSQIEMEVG